MCRNYRKKDHVLIPQLLLFSLSYVYLVEEVQLRPASFVISYSNLQDVNEKSLVANEKKGKVNY